MLSVEQPDSNNKEIFLSLNKNPSFNKLDSFNKNQIIELITNTKKNAEHGHWLIDDSELNIDYPEFASGSFSNIYNCNWRGSRIAIKKPKTSKIYNFLDFLKEISVWSSLRHPNLVQFMGISFDNDYKGISILMEKVDGINLSEYLKKPTMSLSYTKKNHITSELINVINFLHNCKPPIIYRDLKPENVLIAKDFTIKLTDFGLSKYYTIDSSGNYVMTGGTGTMRYMAPEVYLNKPYSLKVDVYSLGLIIYYLFTDEKPFNDYNTESLQNYFNNEQLIFSTTKIKNKKIRTIVNKSINRDDKLRYDIRSLHKEWFSYMNQNQNQGCLVC
jgi:serine/threonine protein kinase